MASTLLWEAVNVTLPQTTFVSTTEDSTESTVTTAACCDNGTTHLYDTYDLFIHPHWKLFPTVSSTWHDFIGAYITIVGISGVLGNSLVIWMFVRTKSLRTPPNMFVVNLAISDLTFSAVNGFPLLTLSAVNRRWIFGNLGCQLYALGGSIFGLLSINTMSLIAFDRYQVITKPFEAMKKISHKRAFMQLVIIWAWALTWSLPPLFGWGAFIPEGFQTSCTFDYLTRTTNNRSFVLCLYICGFCIPVAVVFVCYFFIVRTIMTHTKEMKNIEGKLRGKSVQSVQEQKQADIQVAKVSLTVVALYLLSWLPYAAVALIGQFGDVTLVTPFVSELPVMLAKASAMHNPIVYALSHERFRKEVYLRFPWMNCFKPKPKMIKDQSTRRKNFGNSSVSSTLTYVGESVVNDPFPDSNRRGTTPDTEIINTLLGAIVEMTKGNSQLQLSPSSLDEYIKSSKQGSMVGITTLQDGGSSERASGPAAHSAQSAKPRSEEHEMPASVSDIHIADTTEQTVM